MPQLLQKLANPAAHDSTAPRWTADSEQGISVAASRFGEIPGQWTAHVESNTRAQAINQWRDRVSVYLVVGRFEESRCRLLQIN